MRLSVKVVPKSSRDRVAGWLGETLRICVTAAPERGKANAAVIGVLSDALGVPRAAVRIVAGELSQRKTVEVDGLDEACVLQRLAGRPS
jgi:hypothetical protein